MAATKPEFESLLNFRDVTSLLSQPCRLKPAMFYRAARPDDATPSDRNLLAKQYRLCTIIDLRTPTEHIQQSRKLAARARADPQSFVPTPRSTSASATADALPQILGISYRRINFNGPAFSRHVTSQLSWPAYLRLIGLYVTGYRLQAISIVSRDVMAPRGVVGLLLDSLAVCTAEVATVFNDVLSDEAAYPLMVHCTQGKDRTGLISMLTLFLMGVPEDDVQRDYMASQEALMPERAERVKEIGEIGLSEEWADCDQSLVGEVKRWLDKEHGGVEGYLEHAGVTRDTQEKVRRILRA